jgi:hypothetical protein
VQLVSPQGGMADGETGEPKGHRFEAARFYKHLIGLEILHENFFISNIF